MGEVSACPLTRFPYQLRYFHLQRLGDLLHGPKLQSRPVPRFDPLVILVIQPQLLRESLLA